MNLKSVVVDGEWMVVAEGRDQPKKRRRTNSFDPHHWPLPALSFQTSSNRRRVVALRCNVEIGKLILQNKWKYVTMWPHKDNPARVRIWFWTEEAVLNKLPPNMPKAPLCPPTIGASCFRISWRSMFKQLKLDRLLRTFPSGVLSFRLMALKASGEFQVFFDYPLGGPIESQKSDERENSEHDSGQQIISL